MLRDFERIVACYCCPHYRSGKLLKIIAGDDQCLKPQGAVSGGHIWNYCADANITVGSSTNFLPPFLSLPHK